LADVTPLSAATPGRLSQPVGLLEYNLSDPQQVAEAKKNKVVMARCPVFVWDAVELVETLV
jgi:hypothetical protein